MRIALVGPVYPYRGGIAHYTTMLYKALQERDHEVLLISFKRQYPRCLFPGQSDKDPSEHPLLAKGAQYWIDSVNPLTWFVTFLRLARYQPDAIILQWWTTFWSPVWVALGVLNTLFLHKPLLYICHNVLPHEAHWWDVWLARLVLWWGKRFIVQSEDERSRLLICLPKAQATVFSLPVFDMFADERVPKDEARKQLGLPAYTPILLFFGIVRAYKGLADLLSVLPEVKEELGGVLLLVIGEFWEDKSIYLEQIASLHIEDLVIIEDCYVPNEKVALYFSAADLLVAPYREVTGSAVVQMGIGFGCPIITTRVGSLGELAKREPSLALVEPGDGEGLARAIVQYMRRLSLMSSEPVFEQRRHQIVWSDLVENLEQSLLAYHNKS